MRSAAYSVPDDIRATLVRIFAYMGGLAVLAIAAASFFEQPSVLTTMQPEPLPIWTVAERPYPAFELLMPELAGSPFNYAILRRRGDAARKDVMTWGEAEAGRPYAMVEIFRPGPAGERFLDPASEIAARIIDFSVTDDVKTDGDIDSKFGPVPLVDFAIAPRGPSRTQEPTQPRARERRCLGFAQAFDNPPLQISGWYCSAGQEVVDRATVACMLDRLTVVTAETRLDAFFARAELKRTFCGQRSPILAATPERENHLAPARGVKPLPVKLRGHLTAR